MMSKQHTTLNGTPRDITIPVPWGHISGKQWGDPKDQKVLAVHGKQDNCGVFDRLIPMLNGNYYIVAIDMPGHGLSSHFPSGLEVHFMDYVVALKKVVDYLQWNNFYYLGHSLGGLFGIFMAALLPQSIDKLIVIDHLAPEYYADVFGTLKKTFDDFLSMEERMKNGKPPVYTYDEALRKMMTRESSLTKPAAEIVLKRSLIEADDGSGYLFCMDQRLKQNAFPSCTFVLMEQLVSHIRCPTLILLSTQRLKMYNSLYSGMFPLYKKRPNFILSIVDGNHDLHQNHPERVVRFIDRFFTTMSCKL